MAVYASTSVDLQEYLSEAAAILELKSEQKEASIAFIIMTHTIIIMSRNENCMRSGSWFIFNAHQHFNHSIPSEHARVPTKDGNKGQGSSLLLCHHYKATQNNLKCLPVNHLPRNIKQKNLTIKD